MLKAFGLEPTNLVKRQMWCPCPLSLVDLTRLYQPSQVMKRRYIPGTRSLYRWGDNSSEMLSRRAFRPTKFVIILTVFTNDVYYIRHNMYIMSTRSCFSRHSCLMNNYSIHPNMFSGSEIHWSELNLQAYIVISALRSFGNIRGLNLIKVKHTTVQVTRLPS
jgi:hypothetical protein